MLYFRYKGDIIKNEDLRLFFAKYVSDSLIVVEGDATPQLFGDRKFHFLVPLTYITPNYLSMHTFSLISALTNLGHTVTILLHDNNLFSHPHLRPEILARSLSYPSLVEYTIEEIKSLLLTLNTEIKNVHIVKTSDAWRTLAQDRQSFLFFYSLLGNISLSESLKISNKSYKTSYHVIQRPFDIFFSKKYFELSKLELDPPDFLITNQERLESYKYIKNKILELMPSQLKEDRRPILVSTKPNFVFIHNDEMPSANMNVEKIKIIIDALHPSINDLKLTFRYLIIPFADFLTKISVLKDKIVIPDNPTSEDTATILKELLSAVWDKSKLFNKNVIDEIEVLSKSDLKEIINILSSKPIREILQYCNGKFTVSEIAQKTNKQISNTSFYINKLRRYNLITNDKKPKIKLGRIIINLDKLGLEALL
ncbi:hypothetical protein [Caldisericum sp.]|uniref:hypothetical protein n=1 Tax=Caldisericum sp. TaxID=2499687 RepID=UPI003D14173C